MSLIKECFKEHYGAFLESLEATGFSSDQAVNFLPEAASAIFDSTQKTSVFQTIAHLLSDLPYELLITIDVDAIAKKSGMSSDQVASALHAIAPVLLQLYSQKSKEIDTVAPVTSDNKTVKLSNRTKGIYS